MAVSYVQFQYRFRIDTLTVMGTPTFGAALNTTYDPGVAPFRLAITLQTTGSSGTAAAAAYNLMVSKNAGAYAAIGGTTGVLADSNTADYGGDADQKSITANTIGAGTGTFLAGFEVNDGVVDSFTLTRGDYTEVNYCIKLDFTNLNNGDTLDFRCYKGTTTALTTYTQTPRITVTKLALSPAALALQLSTVAPTSAIGIPLVLMRRPVRNLYFKR